MTSPESFNRSSEVVGALRKTTLAAASFRSFCCLKFKFGGRNFFYPEPQEVLQTSVTDVEKMFWHFYTVRLSFWTMWGQVNVEKSLKNIQWKFYCQRGWNDVFWIFLYSAGCFNPNCDFSLNLTVSVRWRSATLEFCCGRVVLGISCSRRIQSFRSEDASCWQCVKIGCKRTKKLVVVVSLLSTGGARNNREESWF